MGYAFSTTRLYGLYTFYYATNASELRNSETFPVYARLLAVPIRAFERRRPMWLSIRVFS